MLQAPKRYAIAAATCMAIVLGPTSAALAYTPSHTPRHIYFADADESNKFFNYDGKPNRATRDRDFPVTMVFSRGATVDRVKGFLGQGPFDDQGGKQYLPWKEPNGDRGLDRDKGRKNACGVQSHSNLHIRVYGGWANTFFDKSLGFYVVGSTHYDHGDSNRDNCPSLDTKRFGFSENAANEFADYFTALNVSGLTVREDYFHLYNHERRRTRRGKNELHIWQNDGKADWVRLPTQ